MLQEIDISEMQLCSFGSSQIIPISMWSKNNFFPRAQTVPAQLRIQMLRNKEISRVLAEERMPRLSTGKIKADIVLHLL